MKKANIKDYSIYQKHKDAKLKILAIGNSFTNNATVFLPWLINNLNNDTICIAKLTQSGSSLAMHWSNHQKDSHNYILRYSDNGSWIDTDIETIDEALDIFDWDIIVIQQASRHSGDYSTYQPVFDYLALLFLDTNPNAKIAWHNTWAYCQYCTNSDFNYYHNNSNEMYDAILDAGNKISEFVDILIPSASLVWQMREQFPEVEDGFSDDGMHITNDFASYALSSLWYEFLISPYVNNTSIGLKSYPDGIRTDWIKQIENIIISLIEEESDFSCKVDLIYS